MPIKMPVIPPPKNIGVRFDNLEIINDHDTFLTGQGDIYLRYTIMDGNTILHRDVRVPGLIGNWKIGAGYSRDLGLDFIRFTITDRLRIIVNVYDQDLWPNPDDLLKGTVDRTYQGPDFGVGTHREQPRDGDYMLKYTIAAL